MITQPNTGKPPSQNLEKRFPRKSDKVFLKEIILLAYIAKALQI
ncbi:hypothetical protein OHW85_16030 [Acinetobacter baumannii]|nr:hypothetical protein [Acinetobacter baumannii]